MSSTTVASVDAYTSDTSQPAPDNYAQFSQQEQVSVSLIDNNLWLVDSSQLNAQTVSEPPVTLINWTTKDQTNVSLDNITAAASSISLVADGTAIQSTLSPIDLSAQNVLQLSEVTGNLQLDSGTSPSGSSDSSSFSSGGMSTTSTSTSSFSGSGGSNTAVGTPISQSTPGTPDSSTPTSSLEPPSNIITTSTSESTPSATTSTTLSPPPTSTTTSTAVPLPSPSPSPTTPVPVPFQVSPTLGLAIVLGIWGSKQLIRKCSTGRRLHLGRNFLGSVCYRCREKL